MVALTACSGVEDDEVATVEQLGQSTQGQSTQGQSTQGQSTQSNAIEAVSVSGVKKNGIVLGGVKVQNGELRANGLAGAGMVGAELTGSRPNGTTVKLRLDGHAIDTSKPLISSDYPAYTSNSDVHLYNFSYLASDGITWKALCDKHTVT